MAKVFDIAFKLGGQLTSSFKNAFSGANNMMGALSAAAGAVGSAAALVSVVDQVTDMQDALAKLSAQTGTYGEDMKQLESVAKNVFRSGYGESFDDVTAAMMQVKNNMRGLSNGELEKVTGNAMILAETFDGEVNEVTRAASNIMNNFGIDSNKAFDLMANGAQNGLNFSNEMFDNLAEYAPLWSAMGYSAEEMFGILQNGASNGVYNLDYLNDVMKEFQIRATDGSKSTAAAVKELGPEVSAVWKAFSNGEASVADMSKIAAKHLSAIDDKVKQNELGVALFGTKWEDLSGDVVLSMLNSGQAVDDFQGSMDKLTEVKFGTFNEALKGIGRILVTDLALPVGQMVLPYMTTFANYLRENMPAAVEATKIKLAELKDYVFEYGPAVAGAVAALGAMKVTMVAVNGATKLYQATMVAGKQLMYAYRTAMLTATFAGGGLKGALAGLRAGLTALNVTMLANPIGLVIVAIAALGAAFVLLYKKSDEFRAMVQPLFAEFANGAQQIQAAVMSVLPAIVDAFSSLGSVIVSLASAAIPLLLAIAQAVFPVIVSIVQLAVPIITALIGTIAEILTGVVVPAITALLSVVQFIFPYIELVITTVLTVISSVLRAAMALISGDWQNAWNILKEGTEKIINSVISFFSGINLYDVGVKIITGLINGIKSMGGAILNSISGLIPAGLKSVAGKVLGGAIPGFAIGGVVKSPTLAMVGEGGDTESIIPWNNSERSKALWLQAGKAIGMIDSQEKANTATNKATQKTVAKATNTSSSSTVIHYAPAYTIHTDKPEEVKRVLKQNDDTFANKYNKHMQDEERLAF